MQFLSLAELHQYWHEHNTCELKHAATQYVPGDGNPASKIVFIGEAPGKDEDIGGRPFIGRAGKFLGELLESIKLQRTDIYITNTVKYRPPDNRDPLPAEIEACRQWLWDEINYIQPTLICTLGRYALNYFIPEAKISDTHGKLLHKKIPGLHTEHFYALFHPAAALYNGGLRDTLITDFKRIPKIITDLQMKH